MTTNFNNASPLYLAFKANEKSITLAIRLAATKSAQSMGDKFNNVYHRSCKVASA